MILFDHERLDVYHLELAFIGWVTTLFEDLKDQKPARIAEVCDHLDRASLSSLFNTAEGNGKRQRATRAKFFDDARGSATECAGCLDALVAKRVCAEARVEAGKQMLARIVGMLTKLVQRYGENSELKEDPADYYTGSDAAVGPDSNPSDSRRSANYAEAMRRPRSRNRKE